MRAQLVDAGRGYDAGNGGESSVSGGGFEEGLKWRRQRWAMERTKGGLKTDPGGPPVPTAPFPDG